MATFTYTAKRKLYDVPLRLWDFSTGTDLWFGGNGGTVSADSGILTFTSGPTNSYINRTLAIAERFPGAEAFIVRARARRVFDAGGPWKGRVYYTTENHEVLNDHYANIPVPEDPEGWSVLQWDMRNPRPAVGNDWIESQEIRSIRIDLVGNGLGGDVWEIDWISVNTTHEAGDVYAIGIPLASIDRDRRVRKYEQRADSGASETWYVSADDLHMIRTDWIMPADQALWDEFLASVEGGEVFEFDPYGTIDNPVAPRQVVLVGDSYRPRRVGQTGRVYYDLTLREI